MAFDKIDISDLELRSAQFAPAILSRQDDVRQRRQQYAEHPLPLYPPLAPAAAYPVGSLGPCLRLAAEAIASKVQAPIELAAQSVLGTAALAAQAHYDVRLPYGQARPCSLFLVTIAASGDRKSSADNEANWPVRQHEKRLREDHEILFRDWKLDHAAWSATKRKIENDAKIEHDERRSRLEELGDEPRRPLAPVLTSGDVTPDGLTKNWGWMHGALGVFSAEGGQFTAGHGMNDDNRLRTAAMLSSLWDGNGAVRIRAGDGVTTLSGRRLSAHLMVQPDAAAGFLSDRTLRDQGLLSRVLLASPVSLAGQRIYRKASLEDERAISAYGKRVLRLLERTPLALSAPNELDPTPLSMTAEAEAKWIGFFNHVEKECGANGDLKIIRDVAAKAAENAARIATVVGALENPEIQQIDLEAMLCGIGLADWYLREALRLAHASRLDPKLLRAQALLDWLRARERPEIGFRDILQLGPSATRTKAAADDAVNLLQAHGWLREINARPKRFLLLDDGGE